MGLAQTAGEVKGFVMILIQKMTLDVNFWTGRERGTDLEFWDPMGRLPFRKEEAVV